MAQITREPARPPPPPSSPSHRDDVSAESLGGVSALEHGGYLRIADTRLLTCGAHGTRPDADLNQVRPGQQQLFDHLAGDNVTRLAGEGGGDVTHTAPAPYLTSCYHVTVRSVGGSGGKGSGWKEGPEIQKAALREN